jgi:O-antigen/teichoic acid export membrane protein
MNQPLSSVLTQPRPLLRTLLLYAGRVDVRVVVGNASSMGATAVLTAVLGIVFWWLAARTYSPASVGLAAAAISACALLGNFCMLGVGTLLISELGRSPRQQAELLSTCLFVSGGFGVVVGVAMGIMGPGLLDDLRPLHPGIWTAFLFALFVSGTTLGLVLDQFVVGILRGSLQFWRNTLYAVCRLVFLFGAVWFAASDQALTIFATWPLANLVSLLALAGGVALRTRQLPLARPRWNLMRGLGSSALSHHALNLTIQAPSQLLPLLVTILLSATTNAYFYPAWMICSVAFVPQTALTITLFAVGARQPEALVSRARLTLALSFVGGLLAVAITWLAGDRVLSIFGGNYVAEASRSLQLLIVAVIPIVIKTHYVALLRIQRRIAAASLALLAGDLLEIGGAAAGALVGGLPGLVIGWLLGLTLESACMIPTVWQIVVGSTRQTNPRAL